MLFLVIVVPNTNQGFTLCSFPDTGVGHYAVECIFDIFWAAFDAGGREHSCITLLHIGTSPGTCLCMKKDVIDFSHGFTDVMYKCF